MARTDERGPHTLNTLPTQRTHSLTTKMNCAKHHTTLAQIEPHQHRAQQHKHNYIASDNNEMCGDCCGFCVKYNTAYGIQLTECHTNITNQTTHMTHDAATGCSAATLPSRVSHMRLGALASATTYSRPKTQYRKADLERNHKRNFTRSFGTKSTI